MPKRAILLVPTIVAMLVPAIATTAGSAFAEPAADECLSKPNRLSPQGSHWFYRVDRANNNRHCWYLGPDGAKARQAAAPKRRAAAAPSAPPAAEDRGEAQAGANVMVTDASRLASTFVNAAEPGERGPAPTRDGDGRERTSNAPQNQMPAVLPAPASAERVAAEQAAAAAPSEPSAPPAAVERAAKAPAAAVRPGESSARPEHILAVAAGALLLVAILFRAIYKLVAVRELRQRRRTPRDRWPSAASAPRPRKSVAAARGSAVAAREADAVPDWAAMARSHNAAREASAAGLIDAVLQRVANSDPSTDATRSHPRPARAASPQRMAALG